MYRSLVFFSAPWTEERSGNLGTSRPTAIVTREPGVEQGNRGATIEINELTS